MRKLGLLSALLFAFAMFVPVAQAGALVVAQPDRVVDVRPDILPIPIDKCRVTQHRIAQQIDEIQERANKKKERYADITSKVQRIINLAEEHGVDASTLVKDLAVLGEKVENFSGEVRELVGILKQAHELACGDDQQAFQDALFKARVQLKIVRHQAKDIKEYITNTVIPDARAVLKEIIAQY